ncbi:hypothetical protein [Nonomuraea zeae]|uniref:Uncharacterized protein n=1 Tax=Nonomuraea zeae TaxID=1642303 RepID=A0A5S4GD66_9ACTN|nr:hypothetical protein [Nonomuraea zeae]TMR30936.1 hypothetical protein ETD85_27630 [Nonomuraea zeae]
MADHQRRFPAAAALLPALDRGWPAVHVCGPGACSADVGSAHVPEVGRVRLPCAHDAGQAC